MSLINEALKRAQKELNRRPFEAPKNQPKRNVPQKRQRRSLPLIPLVCALLFGACASVLAILLLETPIAPLAQKSKQKTELVKEYNLPVAKLPPVYTPPQTQEPTLNPDETEAIASSAPLILKSTFETFPPGKFNTVIAANNIDSPPTTSNEEMSSEQKYLQAKEELEEITSKALATENTFENKALPHTMTPPAKDPIQEFLDTLTINGIMYSGDSSKVLLNNRVFTINSVVHNLPMLTLSEIHPHELVFRSSTGDFFRKEL